LNISLQLKLVESALAKRRIASACFSFLSQMSDVCANHFCPNKVVMAVSVHIIYWPIHSRYFVSWNFTGKIK